MVFHGTEERSNVDSILRFFKNDNWSDGDYCGINAREALLTQRSDFKVFQKLAARMIIGEMAIIVE